MLTPDMASVNIPLIWAANFGHVSVCDFFLRQAERLDLKIQRSEEQRREALGYARCLFFLLRNFESCKVECNKNGCAAAVSRVSNGKMHVVNGKWRLHDGQIVVKQSRTSRNTKKKKQKAKFAATHSKIKGTRGS